MAVIYIVLALITAVIFFVTRYTTVTVKKRDALNIKIDFNLFALDLTKKNKNKKTHKKSKADKKDAEFYKSIHKRFSTLLSVSDIEIFRLCLPIFPAPNEPSELPFLFANRAVGLGIITYLRSHAKTLYVAEDATSPKSDSDLFYHITLRAPLIFLIYIILSLKIDITKNKRRMKIYG